MRFFHTMMLLLTLMIFSELTIYIITKYQTDPGVDVSICVILSLLCSKICSLPFLVFPQFSAYYAHFYMLSRHALY